MELAISTIRKDMKDSNTYRYLESNLEGKNYRNIMDIRIHRSVNKNKYRQLLMIIQLL